MIRRILLALSIATALALPMQAQFSITLQQNGQGSSAANGSAIVMNAPTPGQSATATVVVTFTGSGTANFPSSGQLFGAPSITAAGDAATSLNPFQSVSLTFNYSPPDTAQNTAEFLWPFNQTTTVNTSTGPVTTVIASGAITFNLVGTSPNLVVGQVGTSGFQTIPTGGTYHFQNTLLNTVATTTVGIINSGSGPGSINSIAVTGAGYTLAGVPLLPFTLAAGSQLNVPVQFQPAASGSANGSLQIAFANGTYSAALSGTGIAASFLNYSITQGAATSPLVPGQVVALGTTNLGTPVSAVIQFQNTGANPFVLSAIAVSGAAFSITDGPFLPVTLQPQQTNSITVTYNPAVAGPSSGRLLIGSDSFVLSGQGLGPTLTFSYQAGNGATVPILAGGVVSFPPVVDGQTTSVPFTITNTGNTDSTLSSIGAVDPTGVFKLSNVPALPLQLSPGGSVTFTINFSPVSTGVSSATLVVNNLTFGLTGFPATPPPLPPYSFTGASGTQQPFQQPAIGLSLATPYAYPLSGTLTITVATNNFSPDPAVQFSSGGLQVAFTIPANTLNAVFPGGATQVQLQTGTVAANIKITPLFTVGTATGTNLTPTNPTILTLTVPAAAPTLLSAVIGTPTATALSIAVTGFSDTRSLDHMTFLLTPAPGFTLSASTFSIDVTATSTLWYQSAASQGSGGQFTALIPLTFTQTGAAASTKLTSAISAIAVSATNLTGTSNVLKVNVP